MPQTSNSFTTSAPGIARVLMSECHVCAAFDPSTTPQSQHPKFMPFTAIWDTGATASVITQDVIDACGLKPIGMVQVHHADGVSSAETFLVNIGLPNKVAFVSLKVTKGKLPKGSHALIGMDIISTGDLSITNVGGKTTFSFRHPSLGGTDFVRESRNRTAPQAPEKFNPWLSNKKRKKHK